MPVLTADSIQTANDALDYTADHQQWLIAPGVIASSEANDGVYSNFLDSRLLNYGLVSSDAGLGVFFTGANAFIYNDARATISGFTAMSLNGAGDEVVNEGVIVGTGSNGITFGVDSVVTLRNDGLIYAEGKGVEVASSSAGGLIYNSGRIESGDSGIYVSTGQAFTTRIFSSGAIQADTNAVEEQAGALRLLNSGVMLGSVELADAGDLVRNLGTIYGTVDLAGGDDIFNGRSGAVETSVGGAAGVVSGGLGNDQLAGGGADDILHGDGGRDTLSGLGGNDELRGGTNGDQLAGGAGADRFVYTTVLDSSPFRPDTVADFSHAQVDLIDLSVIDANAAVAGNQAFIFIGAAAFSNVPGQLHYSAAGGSLTLSGDVDGDGVADLSIVLNGVTTVASSDLVL
jgi:Ca2+-binding RTX toxin-like protein